MHERSGTTTSSLCGEAQKNLHSETLRLLNHYQQDRTQAAYCLTVNGLVWDAEVIIRVAYETFAKVAFLATASEEQRDELLHEYWELLGAVYDRQGALKAEASERLLNRFGSQGDSRVIAALRDGRVYRTDPLGNSAFGSNSSNGGPSRKSWGQ
jgi:hypothetical protein